ncbi:TPA: HAMP domain-containing histidine kinase [Clostridioides difficile]|uniref:sensor histidine kinase n=1 Tax=Clostridioides difficile TaxID=1496 RepID=UPI0010B98795|nr:HAMP domain-containing sensor histidine kinase [Clostridioides difficile]MCJ0297770.1 HAMP domain-containing histidine kinase [Clostridioides difficile]MCJ0446121.1 HAMP domain-containing histidine kinase [Clostridioides difficile]MCJ0448926.1 HAMP domain-containing histidine kinase [Clostridioides difficile]MDK3265653.1 HAMP domain-containing sensor histidine kinase [Clostridioides difficile]MDL0370454.1 HAMP domain-containing sensor histidine kinase [Clostridioides difficile]
MKVFSNKDIKIFFLVIISVLLMFIVVGQIVVINITNDYKSALLEHDYNIAGYLNSMGVDKSKIPAVFTTNEDKYTLKGKEILNTARYDFGTDDSFMPSVKLFQGKYIKTMFLYLFVFFTMIIFILYVYFFRQQNKIEEASYKIDSFMNGNINVRLNTYEEGSLSKLFGSIDAMSTSLNTHILKEKQNKEFLKNTISDISHQLKTPLTALMMYNQILQEESHNSEIVENFVQKSQNELECIESLIQNLLKITKIDSKTIILNKASVNVKKLITKILYSFETRAEKEGKSISIRGLENTNLFCDYEWISEALSNLIKNALDNTKENDKIMIEWVETPITTIISVSDTGNGIHIEDIHHIFKRFYRSKFSKSNQGLGLGLPLVKSIIEQHNGTITVESNFLQGSTFTLSFLKLTNM